jgi:hypothetical protein
VSYIARDEQILFILERSQRLEVTAIIYISPLSGMAVKA